MSEAGLALDGRRRRSDASRRRIALAMLDLAREGEAAPSADMVAERAGVGRRTVFRLFSDMDGVYREMHAVMVERLQPQFLAPFKASGWRARLDELVDRRSRMFDEMLAIKSAADAHRYRSNFLQREHKRLTRLQRDTLRAILPAALAEGAVLEALDLALSFEAWRRLRHEQSLSLKQASAVLRQLVRALVD
ncbi:MAG: TetR/AcrR family transcriptional regulator [Hyphomonadaceae bacterium]